MPFKQNFMSKETQDYVLFYILHQFKRPDELHAAP